jgi:hypothetical protein
MVGLAGDFGHSLCARNDADLPDNKGGIVGLERFVEEFGDTFRATEAGVRSAGRGLCHFPHLAAPGPQHGQAVLGLRSQWVSERQLKV